MTFCQLISFLTEVLSLAPSLGLNWQPAQERLSLGKAARDPSLGFLTGPKRRQAVL